MKVFECIINKYCSGCQDPLLIECVINKYYSVCWTYFKHFFTYFVLFFISLSQPRLLKHDRGSNDISGGLSFLYTYTIKFRKYKKMVNNI